MTIGGVRRSSDILCGSDMEQKIKRIARVFSRATPVKKEKI
jgi:hypothetical protein